MRMGSKRSPIVKPEVMPVDASVFHMVRRGMRHLHPWSEPLQQSIHQHHSAMRYNSIPCSYLLVTQAVPPWRSVDSLLLSCNSVKNRTPEKVGQEMMKRSRGEK
ncbi:hypothetical protein C4D60_Mb07t23670 [Musa balbisiana]|uniref:Uncharacterized protein n=1 Tax=Musa balbisiana TaxID=52838 RepID=A0A4V4H6V9_MUSBA|nr:hypothetical protein C4D60_Mb07t23670 [Musa balbisiana]